MVLIYNLFLTKKAILILCIIIAIDAKAFNGRKYNLSQNKTHYIDNAASEDKHVIPENVSEKDEPEHDEVESYDYDFLLNEYYNDDNQVNGWNSNTTNTDEEESMRWKTIGCSLYETWSQKKRMILRHLWKILKVWFVIYLVVALPLWCTRGWCCCCLFCKFFKSTQTIEEAKRFLEANPPGVLQDKKGGVIFYEPTNNERECYEKFEHLIRTI